MNVYSNPHSHVYIHEQIAVPKHQTFPVCIKYDFVSSAHFLILSLNIKVSEKNNALATMIHFIQLHLFIELLICSRVKQNFMITFALSCSYVLLLLTSVNIVKIEVLRITQWFGITKI